MVDDSAGMVTQILSAVRDGDQKAADELLPLVYGELRKLARARMTKTPPGQTLQPTALVHEAYLRLIGSDDPGWNSRGHFFAAAGQAMRQILVDQARRKAALKRGGDRKRVDLDQATPVIAPPTDQVLALDEALGELEQHAPRQARLVTLRYFAGMTMTETAAALDVSISTVERDWRYVKVWLHEKLGEQSAREED